MSRFTRRQLVQGLSGAAAAALGAPLLASRRASAVDPPAKPPRHLIVLAAAGGGSLIDAALAIRASESPNAGRLNTFEDSRVTQVAGSPIRAVDVSGSSAGQIPYAFSANQSSFVKKHHRDMMVVTVTGTSVNHAVAQRRSITGNEAWNGRTLQEAVAAEYGAARPLPNVNMGVQGFVERGNDKNLPAWAYHEPVADAVRWPVSLDSSKGLRELPARELIEKARDVRQKLDDESAFGRTYARSRRLALWDEQRGTKRQAIEAQDLIRKLMFLPESPNVPLNAFGLSESAEAGKVRERFPKFATDPLQAQAALTFLLIKYQVTVSVTISPSFSAILDGAPPNGTLTNPPLAFDYSHNAHRPAQAIMWDRIYKTADGLIDLLKGEPAEEGSSESLWDRSMIYVATEFGREKHRPSGSEDFGTGHHLNNGYLLISPLVNGDKVLGGVDPATGLTYGFDPTSGEPDPNRTMAEKEIFSGILHALGVDTTGANLPDLRPMRKSA
ncbi:MAG: hypothetical protein HY791_19065 [Deltaproteobacteria bacterium]|nr:hypothetical protein [Deltaproteobacteria bacterium]